MEKKFLNNSLVVAIMAAILRDFFGFTSNLHVLLGEQTILVLWFLREMLTLVFS